MTRDPYPIITSKLTFKSIVAKSLEKYDTGLEVKFIAYRQSNLLQVKVKFPLLEYAIKVLSSKIHVRE